MQGLDNTGGELVHASVDIGPRVYKSFHEAWGLGLCPSTWQKTRFFFLSKHIIATVQLPAENHKKTAIGNNNVHHGPFRASCAELAEAKCINATAFARDHQGA